MNGVIENAENIMSVIVKGETLSSVFEILKVFCMK
jgi:hypothetical protein